MNDDDDLVECRIVGPFDDSPETEPQEQGYKVLKGMVGLNLHESQPKKYLELEMSGQLDSFLARKAVPAYRELTKLFDAGYNRLQAMELIRDRVTFPEEP